MEKSPTSEPGRIPSAELGIPPSIATRRDGMKQRIEERQKDHQHIDEETEATETEMTALTAAEKLLRFAKKVGLMPVRCSFDSEQEWMRALREWGVNVDRELKLLEPTSRLDPLSPILYPHENTRDRNQL
jgi:hypothetical protein